MPYLVIDPDGAPRVKEGAKLLGGLPQLDRFHLKTALHQRSANDPLAAEPYQGCIMGVVDGVERLLIAAQEKADVATVERIVLELNPATACVDANQDGITNMVDVTKIERIILGID